MTVAPRRFPPPWDIEEHNRSCFIVRDNNGQALANVYFETEPGRRTAAKLLTRDLGKADCGKYRKAARAAEAAAVLKGIGLVLKLAPCTPSNILVW